MTTKTLGIKYVSDASKVVSDFNKVGAASMSVHGQMKKLGSAFSSLGLIGPAAIGLVAIGFVKAAAAFDASFTRIAAISNAATEDIQRWKTEVMSLGAETAQAPNDLADALFFLASAGLDAGTEMGVLDMSAKAAAVGLGSVTDIAKITANAMNAYARAGLTATQVTDTLVAAVREGSAEPEEFAAALGRVLPIANQAGVEFGEVTASLAALSNIGLDVNEGVTAMRGLMTALVAPTTQSQEALKAMGLTTDELRASLAENGLIGTLRMLEKATGGNIDQMKELVPNVRALTGVFGLTGQEAKKVNAIFDSVIDSSGSLSEAFKTTAESDAFKLQKALNDIKIAGQELASKTIPVLVGLAKAFDPVVRNAGVLLTVFLGYKALKFVTPLLLGIATALQSAGLVMASSAVLGGAEAAYMALSRIGGAGPIAIAVLSAIGIAWGTSQDRAAAAADAILTDLSGITIQATSTGAAMAVLADGTVTYAGTTSGAIAVQQQFADRLQETTERTYMATVRMKLGQAAVDSLAGAFERASRKAHSFAGMTGKAFKDFKAEATGAIEDITGSLSGFERKWDLTANAAARAMAEMALKSRQMARAYKELDRTAMPEKFRAWLVTQGPNEVHAFVGMSKTQQDKFVANWRETNRNTLAAVATLPKKLQAKGVESGQSFGQGLANGMSAMTSRVAMAARALAQAAVNAANAALGNKSPSKVARYMGQMFVQGLVEGLGSKDDALRTAAEKLAKTVTKALEKALAAVQRDMEQALSAIQKKLDAVQSRADSFQSAIASSFSGLLDLSGAMPFTDEAGALVTPDVGEFMANALGDAQQWADVLQALQTQGVGGALLEQIASMGPDAVGFAQQLLQLGPEQLAAINAQYNAILALSDRVSENLTQTYFGERISELRDALREIRDAFHEDLSAIQEVLHTIARALAHVTGMASGAVVTRPTLALIGENGPEMVTPLPATRQTPGGVVYNVPVTVNGWVGNDQQIARRIRDEIVQLQRRNNFSSGVKE